MQPLRFAFCLMALLAASTHASVKSLDPRKGIVLDGVWQVEQGSMDQQPAQFTHTVAVPGLVDMAQPAFTEIGKKSPQRQAFWYRRTFKLESVTDRTLLLIRKARYGSKIQLNVCNFLAGPNATPEQRRVVYARTLAAKTEFWRCQRKVAGVLHFCGLGYSRPSDNARPQGATSDHFVDMERLIFEPNFEKYMREAFSPLGIMLDYWGADLAPGQTHTLKVYIINDLDKPWTGPVTLRLIQNDKEIARAAANCTVDPAGQQIVSIPIRFPQFTGPCTLSAEVTDASGVVIHSLRDVKK